MSSAGLGAFSDLLRRYSAVLAASWATRRTLDAESRLAHELAFLPAHLEVIETPVHPMPKWAMRSIVALGLLTLAIAVFGQLDIVVAAKGKLVPDARVKFVQPALTGVVRRILVRDGQRVTAGDLLIELDATQAAADSDKARDAKVDAGSAISRAKALLKAQANGRLPEIGSVEGGTPERHEQSTHLAEGLFREYRDKLAAAQAEMAKREADFASTRHQVAKLDATVPLARQQANDYRSLVDEAFVAKHEYLSKEQTALEQEHELKVQTAHGVQLTAAIAQQAAEISALASQFRREQLDALDKATRQYAQLKAEDIKAQTRQGLLTLRAPVSGTVQQLVPHTIGGVATAAQSVMEIVPDDEVEIEATIENKDVGFVRAGQDAVIKVDAFPFTRFGTLPGKVVSVSNDAIQDKKRGLTFVARIAMPTNRMHVNGQWVDLHPGLEVSAEINTGKRSVAHYVLDPLVETAQESLHER